MNETPEEHLHRPPESVERRLPRYRGLKRNLIIIPLLAALIPLVIMAAINYNQDTRAYRAEKQYTLTRLLSNAKRSLQFAIEERRAVLSLVARGRSVEELNSNAALMANLRDLRESFGDFVDLGIINSDGHQVYYAGPYDLQNVNYKDQPWFHEVSLRGVYVSDVFMGHRNLPHFVIAVAREIGDDDFFILRASMDTELLMRQIYGMDLTENMDAFVLNRSAILQTQSAFYGDVLDSISISISPHVREREIITQRETPDGDLLNIGFAYVENTPFVLAVASNDPSALKHWLLTRSSIIWFLVFSVIGIWVVVWMRSRHIITHLHESDIRRAKVFHNIEYTNKMATLGRLAAGVAHEINNPLAIINEKAGLVQDMASMREDFPERDKILKSVDTIVSSVDRCSRVTRRLLGFGRRMDAAKERIDLKNLMEDVLEFQRTEAAHRSIAIEITVEGEVPAIESDRGQLQQVFLNLISNAYAAVEDGGRIDISISHPNTDEVVVKIADNGTGISKEDLENIFEPFFSTKGESGTGLGLSITRDIVEKLGGVIDATSIVGQGTTFVVNLPVEKVV